MQVYNLPLIAPCLVVSFWSTGRKGIMAAAAITCLVLAVLTAELAALRVWRSRRLRIFVWSQGSPAAASSWPRLLQAVLTIVSCVALLLLVGADLVTMLTQRVHACEHLARTVLFQLASANEQVFVDLGLNETHSRMFVVSVAFLFAVEVLLHRCITKGLLPFLRLRLMPVLAALLACSTLTVMYEIFATFFV
jgi:hypothetical protein